MRQSVPSVRALMPGASDRAERQDHHGGMLPVPGLSGRVLRRQALSAAGAGRQTARGGEGGGPGRRDMRPATLPPDAAGSIVSQQLKPCVGTEPLKTSGEDIMLPCRSAIGAMAAAAALAFAVTDAA